MSRKYIVVRMYEVLVHDDDVAEEGAEALAIGAAYQDDVGDYHALGLDIDKESGELVAKDPEFDDLPEGATLYDYTIESYEPAVTKADGHFTVDYGSGTPGQMRARPKIVPIDVGPKNGGDASDTLD